jgi:hypothetical protein
VRSFQTNLKILDNVFDQNVFKTNGLFHKIVILLKLEMIQGKKKIKLFIIFTMTY